MNRLFRALAAALAIAGAQGCSPRMHGTQSDLPTPPALGAPIDRVGRPLTGNALIGLLAPEDVSDRRKEAYNRAGEAAWPEFADDIEHSLGLYDGLDGRCGDQWLAARSGPPRARYRELARLLADDRLWIDSRAAVCTRFLAVELAAASGRGSPGDDCGGRTPGDDAIDVLRSLLVSGAPGAVDDGVDHDDRVPSTRAFPFLAAP